MARSETQVLTGKVRLSFLNVFKPRPAKNGGAPKYSACILIPKSDKTTYGAIKAACDAARLSSAGMFNGKVPERLKLPIHDGDGEMPNGGDYGAECKGMWVLNASSINQPGIVNRQVQPIIDPKELYSGCWARVDLNFFAYNTDGNRGIGAGLSNIQKIADDKPLGGAAQRPDEVFSAFEEDDGDDLGL